MQRSAAATFLTLLGVSAPLSLALGCQPYRIEYHNRPAYHGQSVGAGPLPDEVVLDDGTIIRYRTTTSASLIKKSDSDKKQRGPKVESKPLELREELTDGTVILRAKMPEHVLSHLSFCLREEEYDLIYQQLLATSAREEYEAEGLGEEDFTTFCKTNRRDLLISLNRMIVGMPRQEVMMTGLGDGLLELKLRSHLAKGLRFSRVQLDSQVEGLRFVRIE